MNPAWANVFGKRARAVSPVAPPQPTAAPAVGSGHSELDPRSAPATGAEVDPLSASAAAPGSNTASAGGADGSKRPRLGELFMPSAPLPVRICVCNMGSVCPRTGVNGHERLANKAAAMLGAHIQAADIVMFPEARVAASSCNNGNPRSRQLEAMRLPGFEFEAADGGLGFAVYVRTSVRERLQLKVSFRPSKGRSAPGDSVLLGRVALVEGEGVAIVGVYAPAMQVKRDGTGVTGAGPEQRAAIDAAFFELLAAVDAPVVALVGDFNLRWEAEGGGLHGAVRQRWKEALGRLGFGEPLDRPDASGQVAPTTWPAARDNAGSHVGSPWKAPCRVDFLFVRQRATASSAVAGFGRHERPACSDDHMHLPLWLELNVRASGSSS